MSDDHDLEVLAGDGHAAVDRAVEALDQCQEIVPERRLRFGLERREGLEYRAVEGFEDFKPMLRRTVTKHEVARRRADRRIRAEQFLDACLGAL